jgi:hypothetical protein
MRNSLLPLLFFFFLAMILFGVSYGAWAYLRTDGFVAPTLQKVQDIAPDEAVRISLDFAVASPDFLRQIRVMPALPVRMEWEGGESTLVLTPKDAWKLETRYTVILPEVTPQPFRTLPETRLTFQTKAYPNVVSVTPENGAKDVILGVEDPIRVRFDRSTKDFYVKFSLNPEEELTYQNNFEKTEFQLLPKTGALKGQHYRLTLFVKHRNASDKDYVKVFESTFSVLPPFEGWEKDFAKRLEQARIYTPAKISSGKYIDINLSSQVMVIFENGRAIDAYLVSSGKRGMDTPQGSYTIQNKALKPWSKQYSLYMPHWMALTSDGKYGIHELPEWPGGYKEGQDHLGTPVSHGCVRLGVGAAKTVYEWAEVGTPVIVHE